MKIEDLVGGIVADIIGGLAVAYVVEYLKKINSVNLTGKISQSMNSTMPIALLALLAVLVGLYSVSLWNHGFLGAIVAIFLIYLFAGDTENKKKFLKEKEKRFDSTPLEFPSEGDEFEYFFELADKRGDLKDELERIRALVPASITETKEKERMIRKVEKELARIDREFKS